MRFAILALFVVAASAARPLFERVAGDLELANDFLSQSVLENIEYDLGYLDYREARDGQERVEQREFLESLVEQVEAHLQ